MENYNKPIKRVLLMGALMDADLPTGGMTYSTIHFTIMRT